MPATLAPLAHRLELRGLLAREINPANHRCKLLALTDDGNATLDRIRPLSETVDTSILGGLRRRRALPVRCELR